MKFKLKFKKYGKAERSTFPYWFAHYRAYNMLAWNLGIWKPKYLLHDIEKPWLKLYFRYYKKVQKYHREHSPHHIEYYLLHHKADWEAMVIDWESSPYTKLGQPWGARENLLLEIEKHPQIEDVLNENIRPILDRLGL